MKVSKGLHEIMATRYWDMHPDVLATLRSNILHNIAGNVEIAATPSMEGSFVLKSSSLFQDRLYIGNADAVSEYFDLQEDDRIINVLNIDGPITRDGGVCSYGSREHRDWLMSAADMPETIGHILIQIYMIAKFFRIIIYISSYNFRNVFIGQVQIIIDN